MPPQFHGTLRPHPSNPRYFTNDTGRAIYLTGSHTWASIQETALEGDPPFPFPDFLQFLSDSGHNFTRLWTWEQPERASWTKERMLFYPLPWMRTGPGTAADGGPRFDLYAWNPEYFDRLRQRCIAAGQLGIYVSVMLFQGWSLPKTSNDVGDPHPFHPFNAANNINGVDIPLSDSPDDERLALHSMVDSQVLQKQRAWVRKVVDTVNDLDHVLYEVINEGGSAAWQYHIVELVRQIEQGMPKQHPVGMTSGPRQQNPVLFDGPADWISPTNGPHHFDYPGSVPVHDYINDPPPADGGKVVLVDTDHLWGHGGNAQWVWKSFTRGHQPIFMDPWWPLYVNSTPALTPWAFTGGVAKDQRDYPDWGPTRRAMGDTRRYAERVDLAAMTPRPDLASTQYCLANPGREYLIYLPDGGDVTVDVGRDSGPFAAEWFIPQTGQTYPGAPIPPDTPYAITTAPFTGDALLYLHQLADGH